MCKTRYVVSTKSVSNDTVYVMTIKVISLNLWWGGNLFPAIIDFLKVQDADIVALQEVHNGEGAPFKDRQRSMEILRANLHYPYDNFSQSYLLREAEGVSPHGNAVLSKYPITRHQRIFLVEPGQEEYVDIPEQWSLYPRQLQVVELKTPGGIVNFFNMHGVWDMDGDSPSPQRRSMVDKTLAAIKGKPNVIVTGDTNAKASNPVWQELEQQLTSVFGTTLTTTFNMRRKDNPGYATAAVDHMYVSPAIKVISRQCPDVDISDHQPLVVELQIPES